MTAVGLSPVVGMAAARTATSRPAPATTTTSDFPVVGQDGRTEVDLGTRY
jgi:hypothetical protein